jgi:type I restriction enzyme R subunit
MKSAPYLKSSKLSTSVTGLNSKEQDFLRFEEVNRDILDADMAEMLGNNPPDVVYSAFSQAFFEGAIEHFRRSDDLKNIVLTDAEVRELATRHFFNRALREALEAPS